MWNEKEGEEWEGVSAMAGCTRSIIEFTGDF